MFGLPFLWLVPAVPGRWRRSGTFAASLALHMTVVAIAAWIDSFPPEAKRPRQYQLTMLPKPVTGDDKVLWYDFRRSIPEVIPTEPIGAGKTPQGRQVSKAHTVIADSQNATSDRQMIWRPDRPSPLPADVPAPNLVALPSPATVLPPTPKPSPKRFTAPPTPAPKPPSEVPTVDAPMLATNTPLDYRNDALGRKLLDERPTLRKPPPKPFAAPPGLAKPSSGVNPNQVVDAPSVSAASGTGRVQDLQAVIVGLNPTDRLAGPPPDGSRSGQFSRAATEGAPSSGTSAQGDAPRVPGLMARGSPGNGASVAAPAPSASAAITPERKLIQEIALPSMNRTMSVPLRPSARVIPASVETIFTGRNVYTLVIPGPKLPDYGGDWVLWFAERTAATAAGGRIMAPVPARKYSWAEGTAPDAGSAASGAVQMATVIGRDGRVGSVRILRGLPAEPFRRRAAEELKTWEFLPASRNGEPVEVEIVVEIPFQFRAP